MAERLVDVLEKEAFSWEFLENRKAVKAIHDAAVIFVRDYYGRDVDRHGCSTVTWIDDGEEKTAYGPDQEYEDAVQEARMWLAARPGMFSDFTENKKWITLRQWIYTYLTEQKETLEGVRIEHYKKERGTIGESIVKSIDTALRGREEKAPTGIYSEEKVEELVALIWEPHLLPIWDDPFDRRKPHPNDDLSRRTKADPSHSGDSWAEIADLHRAMEFRPTDLQSIAQSLRNDGLEPTLPRIKYRAHRMGLANNAGLTEREVECIKMRYCDIMPLKEVALALGISAQAVEQAAARGIRKLTYYMNNNKKEGK